MSYESSPERVDHLITLSDRVYDATDEIVDDEPRARRIMCLGINIAAQTLENSYGFRFAGDTLHSFIVGQLAQGGLSIMDDAYDPYSAYRKVVSELQPVRHMTALDLRLTSLSQAYAEVQRATVARDGNLETDASHAVHLTAIALPYAVKYYPDLDPSKLTIYGLVHDILEAYVGDVPTLGLSDKKIADKAALEIAALAQFKKDFGKSHPKLVAMVEAYEELSDDESKFIKTMDKLDPGFTHFDNNGKQLRGYLAIANQETFYATIDMTTRRMATSYALDYSQLMQDREELSERIANVTWPEK